MLLKNYGSFLTEKQKNEAAYNFNKPVIRQWCIGFLFFSVMAAAAMGTAVFHAMYTVPHAVVPAVSYSRAQAASSRVSKSLGVLREAHPQDIDVCNVLGVFTEAVARSNGSVSVKDILIKPQNYTLKAMGKDIASANDFLKSLPFDSRKFDKQLSDIRESKKMAALASLPGQAAILEAENNPVEFTIIVTPKAAAKNKKAAPKAPASNAVKGGSK